MCAAPLNRFLGGSDALSRLQDHASRLLRLQNRLDPLLPATMRGAIRVANFEMGTLSLHAPNASAASRLKMSQQSLISGLQGAGEAVQFIKIKVRPIHSSERNALYAKTERRVGEQGRDALKSLGDKLDADSPLAKALQNMLKNSR